jgi:hypothetical protein
MHDSIPRYYFTAVPAVATGGWRPQPTRAGSGQAYTWHSGGRAKCKPDRLTFGTGKLYVLHIDNPGSKAYYFGSQGMADAVYTRKVSVLDSGGQAIREVYGPVRSVEVKPRGQLEW